MSSRIDLDINKIVLKFVGEKPLNKEEKSILKDWMGEANGRAALLESLKDPDFVSRQLAKMEAVDTNAIWDKVLQYKNPRD